MRPACDVAVEAVWPRVPAASAALFRQAEVRHGLTGRVHYASRLGEERATSVT